MKRILLVAFHFPPLAGSSGIQRTLGLTRYLPMAGWEPLVLTAHPRAYERTSDDLMTSVPDSVPVVRSQAWDTARHLSVAGRYPGCLARPDRWVSWKFDSIRRGRALVAQFQPAVIWSTYPIATAHLIAAALHRGSGVPWVADFRDPMAQDGYPADTETRRQFLDIEKLAAADASALVFTTPGARNCYQARYPHARDRMWCIENGYDEEIFLGLPDRTGALTPGKVTLVHSGIIYPSERDPRHFLDAVVSVRRDQPEMADDLRIRFRACAHEQFVNEEIRRRGLEGVVETAPAIPYREALDEMCRADGLLVMQASNCNDQVPAKLYEYFRTGRPVIGLTDPAGDTAATMGKAGITEAAPLDDPQAIAMLLRKFLAVRDAPAGFCPLAEQVELCSRDSRARELAAVLDRIAGAQRA